MRCLNHPEVEAKWRCVECRRAFCEKCIKMVGARADYAAVCSVCGEKCVDVTESEEAVPSREPSFYQRLPNVVSYPLRGDGAFMLGAGAVFFAIAEFVATAVFLVAILIGVITAGYLCRFFLCVIYDSAMGKPSPPTWPDFDPAGYVSESLDAIMKFISPAIISYGPAVAYYILSRKELDRGSLALLVAAGSFYYPMGLTAVAVFDDLRALNPVAVIRSIFRVPESYLVTCILFIAILCLNYLRGTYLIIPVFAIGSFIRWFVLLYLWTVAMHLLGTFYHANRHRLDWT